ncbi:hypothetical protein [Kribbella yunnanensis]|uniref:hypothetical protein n=1 Tax=Kribbella yunnanensis TaxID=190194 RepID=UPI0031D7DDD9
MDSASAGSVGTESTRLGSASGSEGFESTAAASSSYVQPPVAAVADPRTARGTTELSGPRTAAIRESKAAANRRPRQAADSTAVDADGHPVSRTARGAGSKRRPFIAVAAVLLVITPISWLLLHQPQNDEADASLPIGTRTDDSYATPSTIPVDDPTVPPKKPTATPTAPPTGTPTASTTPTAPPTSGPTNTPTTVPTDNPTSTATTVPTNPPTSQPTTTPTGKPTKTPPPPPPPPPPAADGDMTNDEIQLFNQIDSARKSKGCAPLEQDAPVTYGARSDAQSRSKSGNVNASGSSMSAAGGDNWSSNDAFNQMMAQSKGTLLNCGLRTLGVGRGTYKYCTSVDLLGLCIGKRVTRVGWVADFN